MKEKFYKFLAFIQFKIDEFLTDKGYYEDVVTTLDKSFWSDYDE